MVSSQKGRQHYNLKRRKHTNSTKVEEAINNLKKLGLRLQKEGPTKWIVNAIKFAEERLKKYNMKIDELRKEFKIDLPKKTLKVKREKVKGESLNEAKGEAKISEEKVETKETKSKSKPSTKKVAKKVAKVEKKTVSKTKISKKK